MAAHDYAPAQPAPQSALQSLLQPPMPIRQRLAALDASRETRISQLHRAASLRWESRGRLARQRLIDGSLDIHGYRREVADADAARASEELDVPPQVDRAALQERAYAVAQEAVARFYDEAIVRLEQVYTSWTPATLEQAEGGDTDAA
jgi:hypothetical protein